MLFKFNKRKIFLSGKEFSVDFKDLSYLFDPIAYFKEFKLRQYISKIKINNVKLDIDSLILDIENRIKDIHPLGVVETNFSSLKFRVEFYRLIDSHPLNFYLFYFDGKLLGYSVRFFDYSEIFNRNVVSLRTVGKTNIIEFQQNNELLFLEKFDHTYFWKFKNKNLLYEFYWHLYST